MRSFLFFVLAIVVTPVHADETAAKLFDQAAKLDGAPYTIARQQLESRGEEILPLLQAKSASEVWRESTLAKALQLHINQPHLVAHWRLALYGQGELQLDDEGNLFGQITEKATLSASKQGVFLVAGKVVFPQEAMPIVIDCLREFANERDIHSREINREHFFTNALLAIEHFKNPIAIDPLIEYSTNYNMKQAYQPLLSLGVAAIPSLHKAISETKADWPSQRRAIVLVRVLGEIGNQQSAELLIETLPIIPPKLLSEYWTAIAKLNPPNTSDVLFDQLVQLVTREKEHKYVESYVEIRTKLLSLGDDARKVLSAHIGPDQPLKIRGLAAGILFELDNPGKASKLYEIIGRSFPHRLVVEEPFGGELGEPDTEQYAKHGHAVFWHQRLFAESAFYISPVIEMAGPMLIELAIAQPSKLNLLSTLKGNAGAIELLGWYLTGEHGHGAARRLAIVPLAETGGVEALKFYRAQLSKQGPPWELETIVEGALIVGNPQSGEFLTELVETFDGQRLSGQRAKQVAEIQKIADRLRNSPNELSPLLAQTTGPVQFAVAKVMAANGDLACVPTLFELAVASSDKRFGRRQKSIVIAAQRLLVEMGQPAVNEIETTAGNSSSKYASLLFEVLKIRITQSELVERTQLALLRRYPGLAKHVGPTLSDIEQAGKILAEAVGMQCVPLLEANIIWHEYGSPEVAAMALAELKQERSIQVILENSDRIGIGRRNVSFAGAALAKFGEKGIEAAKKIKAPDPDQANFRGRRGMHRAATSTLAAVDDIHGVEDVLEGLALAANGEIDVYKTKFYLSVAAKYKDERLVPAIITVLEKHNKEIAINSIVALQHYDDERLIPIYLRYLNLNSSLNRAALAGLARIKGDDTVAFLLNELATNQSDAVRTGIVGAFGGFQFRGAFVAGTNLDSEIVAKHLPEIRTAVRSELENNKLNTVAARSLVSLMYRIDVDDQTTSALVEWLKEQDEPDWEVLKYLVRTRDPRVGLALHQIYSKDPMKRFQIARHLATLEHEPSLELVVRTMRDRIRMAKTKWGIPEIDILAKLGEKGRDVLFEDLRTELLLEFQVTTLYALSKHHDQRAFDPALALFKELIATGIADPRVHETRSRSREENYRYQTELLAKTIGSLNPEQALPVLSESCISAADEQLRSSLANQVQAIQRRR